MKVKLAEVPPVESRYPPEVTDPDEIALYDLLGRIMDRLDAEDEAKRLAAERAEMAEKQKAA